MISLRRRQRVSHNMSVTLTPMGKQKVDNYGGEGIQFDIMCHLSESGPTPVAEIAREVGANPRKVEKVVRVLSKQGYVRPVGADGE